MRELLERIRVPLLFVLLVAVSLVALASDRRATQRGGRDHGWLSGAVVEIAAPVQRALSYPVELARDGWSSYVALVDLSEENEELRARIAALEEENLQYREALVASGRLARIADMRDDIAVPLQPALVVGQDVSPWFRSVLLDRGQNDGVLAGMPVLTDRGVVGLVTATTRNTSRAMLLLDGQSAVDGIVQRSRARGIVRGRGGDRLELELFVRGDDVQVGDVVISSGFGGVYPKGLRLGTVTQVAVDEDQLLHRAVLQPLVDFGRLEEAFVMRWRGPTLDLLYAGEGDLREPATSAEAPAEAAPDS